MKSIRLFVTAILVGALISSNSSTAAEPKFQVSIQELMQSQQPVGGARGIVWSGAVELDQTIGWIRYSMLPKIFSGAPAGAPNYWDFKLCSSWSDATCPIGQGIVMEERLFLGHCNGSNELGCVESFSVTDSSGKKTALKFLTEVTSSGGIPQDLGMNIPSSSSPSIFQSASGDLYLIRASIFVAAGSPGAIPQMKFDMDVNPVAKVLDSSVTDRTAVQMNDTNNGTHYVTTSGGGGANCAAVTKGICYRPIEFNPNEKFGVSLRIPNLVTGWLHGRAKAARVYSETINSTTNRLNVDAEPADLIVAGGWVKYSDLPDQFIEKLYPTGGYDKNPSASYALWVSPGQNTRGLEEYAAWSPLLKDKALTVTKRWSVGTERNVSDVPCLTSSKQVNGFLGTNASEYSSLIPTWNPSDNSFSYRVAAPHFTDTGELSQGSYTLALPESAIKCLFGNTGLPTTASISVEYSGETTNVGTVSMGTENGWSHFEANGFHYSEPTIKIKFANPVPIVTPSPTPTPSPSETPVPVADPIGAVGTPSGMLNPVLPPIMIDPTKTKSVSVKVTGNLVLTVKNPGNWKAKIAKAGIVKFVPGGNKGTYVANPGFKPLKVGTTTVVLTDGKKSYNLKITVTK